MLKLSIAREVAERVGDQAAAVELQPAHDVRAGADDEVGARVDRRAREVAAVAAVLAERVLAPAGDARLVGPLGAGVEHRTTTGARRAAARTSERTAASELIGALQR